MNVSKNLRGECHPKNQIKRDSLVMLKRIDYVINLLLNLVSSYSELKTLGPARLIIKTSISTQNYHSFNMINMINNGNRTEWSAIWSEIIRVISKSNERAARVRFEITSMTSDQNCTTRSSITTLLHPL